MFGQKCQAAPTQSVMLTPNGQNFPTTIIFCHFEGQSRLHFSGKTHTFCSVSVPKSGEKRRDRYENATAFRAEELHSKDSFHLEVLQSKEVPCRSQGSWKRLLA